MTIPRLRVKPWVAGILGAATLSAFILVAYLFTEPKAQTVGGVILTGQCGGDLSGNYPDCRLNNNPQSWADLGISAMAAIGSPVPVANGGTGTTSAGATAAGDIGALAVSSNLSDLTNTAQAQTNLGLTAAAVMALPVAVLNGGTGATSLTASALLAGNGTSPVSAITNGTTGQMLGGVTGSKPAFGGGSSLGTSGWQSLPSGITIQWGCATITTTLSVYVKQAISFPTSFGTRAMSVTLTPGGSTVAGTSAPTGLVGTLQLSTDGLSTTGFNAWALGLSLGGTNSFCWQAVGF